MQMSASLLCVILLAVDCVTGFAAAKNKTDSRTPAQIETDYTQAIEGRARDILNLLTIEDPAVSNRVADIIITQYRALRAWHDTNDAALKSLNNELKPP